MHSMQSSMYDEWNLSSQTRPENDATESSVSEKLHVLFLRPDRTFVSYLNLMYQLHLKF